MQKFFVFHAFLFQNFHHFPYAKSLHTNAAPPAPSSDTVYFVPRRGQLKPPDRTVMNITSVSSHKLSCTRQHSLWLKKYGKVIRCLSLLFGTNSLENMKCTQGPHASVNSSCAQPPRATAVHLPALSVLGVGAFANFALPRGRAFANPGAISELWTRTQFRIRITIITTQNVLLEKGRLAHLSRTGIN